MYSPNGVTRGINFTRVTKNLWDQLCWGNQEFVGFNFAGVTKNLWDLTLLGQPRICPLIVFLAQSGSFTFVTGSRELQKLFTHTCALHRNCDLLLLINGIRHAFASCKCRAYMAWRIWGARVISFSPSFLFSWHLLSLFWADSIRHYPQHR